MLEVDDTAVDIDTDYLSDLALQYSQCSSILDRIVYHILASVHSKVRTVMSARLRAFTRPKELDILSTRLNPPAATSEYDDLTPGMGLPLNVRHPVQLTWNTRKPERRAYWIGRQLIRA